MTLGKHQHCTFIVQVSWKTKLWAVLPEGSAYWVHIIDSEDSLERQFIGDSGRPWLCTFIALVSWETELQVNTIVLVVRWSWKTVCQWNWWSIISAQSLFRSLGRQSFTAWIHTYIHTFMHVYQHIYIFTGNMHTVKHVWLHVYIHTCIQTCTLMYVYLHTTVSKCIRYMYACIHIYIHAYIPK